MIRSTGTKGLLSLSNPKNTMRHSGTRLNVFNPFHILFTFSVISFKQKFTILHQAFYAGLLTYL